MKINILILLSCIVSLGTACSHKLITSNGSVLYNPEQNNSQYNKEKSDFLEDKEIQPISDVKKNRWEYNRDLNDKTFVKPNNDIQKADDDDRTKKLEYAIQRAYNTGASNDDTPNSISYIEPIDNGNRTINDKNKAQMVEEYNTNNGNNINNVKSGLYIQVGLYKYSSNSTRIKNKIFNSGITNVKVLVEKGQYRVIIGPYKNKSLADDTMETLENIGINDYFWIKR